MPRPTAIPRHTIIRYRPASHGPYAGWRPVKVLRWRLFVDETHEAVMGEPGFGKSSNWDHDWACEELSGDGRWHCNGRTEWPSLEAAVASIDGRDSYRVYKTFDEALAAAQRQAAKALRDAEESLLRARGVVDIVGAAVAPVLP